VAKDPSDCLSPLTSVKSYFSESRYSARYVPANIPWPMTERQAQGRRIRRNGGHQREIKRKKIRGEVCEMPRPYAAAANVVRCDVVRCCFSMMDA